MPGHRILITCEHGGHRIPAAYRRRFRGAGAALAGHRGFDPGALAMARRLARVLNAPLFHSTVSRLLVDLNRSPHHPRLFSEFVRGLDPAEKEQILALHYEPHRKKVEAWIAGAVEERFLVLHLGIHSFTPRLARRTRNADVGILYDPGREPERRFATSLQQALGSADPGLRIRRNYPYRGVSDGFTTHLRKIFGPEDYLGIEIEVNQSRLRSLAGIERLARALGEALLTVLGGSR